MDEAVAEASREELQRSLYSVDEKIICDFFQRDQLWTWEVSPVLMAAATLQTMLRSSPVAHQQCYGQAIQLLEYIHSQSPQPLGNEVEYVDLLVELKTRAVLYELFEEVVITEQRKKEALAQFFGEPSDQNLTGGTAEYSESLHSRARQGLERLLSSDQQWLTFRRTNLFDCEKSSTADASLLRDLTRYLTSIRLSTQPAQEQSNELVEDGSYENVSEGEASEEEEHAESPISTVSPRAQLQSSDTEPPSEQRRRGKTRQRDTASERTQTQDSRETSHCSTEETPTTNPEARTNRRMRRRKKAIKRTQSRGSRETPHRSIRETTTPEDRTNRTPYNLRNQRSKGRKRKRGWPKGMERKVVVDSITELPSVDTVVASAVVPSTAVENSDFTTERKTRSRLRRTNSSSPTDRRSISRLQGINSSYGVEGRTVVLQLGLTPVKVVKSPDIVQRHTPLPRANARLTLRKHGNKRLGGSAALSGSTDTPESKRTEYIARLRQLDHRRDGEERVAVVETGLEPPTTRYQLRQRGDVVPDSDTSLCEAVEEEGEEEEEEEDGEEEEEEMAIQVNRAAGRKRKRWASGKGSAGERSDSPERALSRKEQATETGTPREGHQEPRRKRRVVFYGSEDSSQERTSSGGSGSGMRMRGRKNKATLREVDKSKFSVNLREGDKGNNGGGGESGNNTSGAPRRNRRKQVTPRRLVNDRLVLQVYLPQGDNDNNNTTSATVEHKHTIDNKGTTSGPNTDGLSTEHHSCAHVLAHTTESSSECEAADDGVFRNLRHGSRARHHHHNPSSMGNHKPRYFSSPARHKPHSPYSTAYHHSHPPTRHRPRPLSSTGHHRVVDLADTHAIEQSQPNSQWDYVAVQTIAECVKLRSRRSAHHNPRQHSGGSRRGASDIEMSDREQMTCCSSEEEVALATLVQTDGADDDKLSVVSETSPGSSSPVTPALLSLHVLRKRK